jgi:hypothetical protein
MFLRIAFAGKLGFTVRGFRIVFPVTRGRLLSVVRHEVTSVRSGALLACGVAAFAGTAHILAFRRHPAAFAAKILFDRYLAVATVMVAGLGRFVHAFAPL